MWHYQHKLYILIFLAILTGLIATSRIVFFFVPFLFSFLIIQKGKIYALFFATLSIFVCIGLHLYFHNLTHFYPPIHLLNNKGELFPIWLKLSAIISCSFIGISIIMTIANNLFDTLIRIWAVFFFPLFFTSLGDLNIRNWDFSVWEGANYLIPPIFFALTLRALSLNHFKKIT